MICYRWMNYKLQAECIPEEKILLKAKNNLKIGSDNQKPQKGGCEIDPKSRQKTAKGTQGSFGAPSASR